LRKRTEDGVISTTSPSSGKHRTARLAQERGDVRREEVLTGAEPDDERRLAPDPDEQVGMVVMDHDDGEVAFEERIDAREGGREIAVVLALEQVDDHLCVCLRPERVPLFEQLRLELAVVLDDAVDDDRNLRPRRNQRAGARSPP